jgi:hypothetical protein
MGEVSGLLTTFTSGARVGLQAGATALKVGYLSVDEAEEFFSCAITLAQLHHRCWESHVILWSLIREEFSTDHAESIRKSAEEVAELAVWKSH